MISTDCGQSAIEKAEFQPGTKLVVIKKTFKKKCQRLHSTRLREGNLLIIKSLLRGQ